MSDKKKLVVVGSPLSLSLAMEKANLDPKLLEQYDVAFQDQEAKQTELLEQVKLMEYKYLPSPRTENTPKIVTFKRTNPKIGRNDLCPCGSSLKYKKCCLKNKP